MVKSIWKNSDTAAVNNSKAVGVGPGADINAAIPTIFDGIWESFSTSKVDAVDVTSDETPKCRGPQKSPLSLANLVERAAPARKMPIPFRPHKNTP